MSKGSDFPLFFLPSITSFINEEVTNQNIIGIYIIQKLREEDLRENQFSLDIEESNSNSENIAEELQSKLEIVEMIKNNRDILMNLEDFYEEDCQLSLLNWAWNIYRRFYENKNIEPRSDINMNTITEANCALNKDLLLKNNCLNYKAEILLLNILNIFEIFPIKPDDLKSLKFIEKLREIKKDMKSRNIFIYKRIKKLIHFWKKMIKFFDSQCNPKPIIETNTKNQILKPFDLTLNQKRQLEDCPTGKKEKNKKPNFFSSKEDGDNMSANISLDETESGEHRIKKKNVTWKNEESLVEKIEYNPMNAPFEI